MGEVTNNPMKILLIGGTGTISSAITIVRDLINSGRSAHFYSLATWLTTEKRWEHTDAKGYMLYVICNISAVYAEIRGIRVLFTCESPKVYLWLCVSLRQAIRFVSAEVQAPCCWILTMSSIIGCSIWCTLTNVK